MIENIPTCLGKCIIANELKNQLINFPFPLPSPSPIKKEKCICILIEFTLNLYNYCWETDTLTKLSLLIQEKIIPFYIKVF